MLHQTINEKLYSHLLDHEIILWFSQPDTGRIFTMADLFIVPFSLLWGGMAIFFEVSNITSHLNNETSSLNIPATILGIVFMIVGLYFIFGRFFYKNWKKKRTYYAVTNQRIISLTEAFGKQFRGLDLKSIIEVDLRARSDKTGSIIFNPEKSTFFSGGQFPRNTGMELLEFHPFSRSQDPIAFFDIANVNDVYKMINTAKADAIRSGR